jgi:hypothetical protein
VLERLIQALEHRVERLCQAADFVVRLLRLDALAQIRRTDPSGGLCDVGYGSERAFGEEEPARGREKQYERDGDGEADEDLLRPGKARIKSAEKPARDLSGSLSGLTGCRAQDAVVRNNM